MQQMSLIKHESESVSLISIVLVYSSHAEPSSLHPMEDATTATAVTRLVPMLGPQEPQGLAEGEQGPQGLQAWAASQLSRASARS